MSQTTTLSPSAIAHAAQLGVAGRGAAEVEHGRRPAHDLVDRGAHQRRVVAQPRHRPRGAPSAPACRGRSPGGWSRCRRRRAAGTSCRTRARSAALPSSSSQVTSFETRSSRGSSRRSAAIPWPYRRPRSPPGCGTGAGGTRRSRAGRVEPAQVGVGVADHLVAPVDQAGRPPRRHAEDPAQHLDRELLGDLLDEVELALGQRVVEDAAASARRSRSSYAATARGVKPLFTIARRRVCSRRVGVQHRLAGLDLVGVEVLERGGAGLRRERPPVLEHRDDVVVAGDAPEALPVLPVVPVHGRGRCAAARTSRGARARRTRRCRGRRQPACVCSSRRALQDLERLQVARRSRARSRRPRGRSR